MAASDPLPRPAPSAKGRTEPGAGPSQEDASAALALAARLVATDSVNPGLVPGAPGEGAAVGVLHERLAAGGWACEVVTPAGHPDRPSLIAWTPGPRRRTVVLTGHLDTVGVDGMPDPFAARIEGDILLGRGACDMKGGVAAIVVAAEVLARDPQSPRVVLALVADEEDRSLGTEAVLGALPGLGLTPDVALVAEPTSLDLARSHRGYSVVEVELLGRAAHSAQPELGLNCAHVAARLVADVEAAGRVVAASGGSLLVTVLEAGHTPFVVPARARVVIERRTVPGERAGDALAEVEALLVGLRTHEPDLTATATLTHAREAWRLDDDGPAARLAHALRSALATDGATPGSFDAPYWMESPLWQDAGIPTVVCGPGGGGLHAADEWLDLGQLRRFVRALPVAVRRMEGDPDAD